MIFVGYFCDVTEYFVHTVSPRKERRKHRNLAGVYCPATRRVVEGVYQNVIALVRLSASFSFSCSSPSLLQVSSCHRGPPICRLILCRNLLNSPRHIIILLLLQT